jgi:hypothetical protein
VRKVRKGDSDHYRTQIRLTLRLGAFFLRHLRNRATACLKSGSVRLPVRETLANSATHGKHRTVTIL